MKILFLDVDGVLNRCGMSGTGTLESDKVQLLMRIVSRTGCRIVISSTWRKHADLRVRLIRMAEDIGAEIAGWTPVLEERAGVLWKAAPRWHEIKAWLLEHPEVERYAILDDDADMSGLPHAIVRTNSLEGLTEALAEEVIRRLGD